MDLKAIQAALIFGGGKADDSGRDNAPSDWVEAVCERFTTSGETITCSPLAGRALAVTVQGKTTQAGEGKARPDNIRALSGLGESGTLTLTAEGGKTRTVEIPLTGPLRFDFSHINADKTFEETIDGNDTQQYKVTFDSAGRIASIQDENGHITEVVWE